MRDSSCILGHFTPSHLTENFYNIQVDKKIGIEDHDHD